MLPCEIAHPDWESERLVACKNPFLAAERAREREALLRATEADHAKVVVSVSSGRLRDPGKIGLRSGRGLNRHRMGKHCDVEIAEEARPDGIYVIRTSGTNDALSLSALVEIYESLAHIERDFRIMKRFDLRIRPIRRRLADRVPAHAFICLLAAHLVINLSSISAPPGRRSPSKTSSRLGAKSRCCSPCASDRRRRRWRSAVERDSQELRSSQGLLDHLGTLTERHLHPSRHDRLVRVPHGAHRDPAASLELIEVPIPLRLV